MLATFLWLYLRLCVFTFYQMNSSWRSRNIYTILKCCIDFNKHIMCSKKAQSRSLFEASTKVLSANGCVSVCLAEQCSRSHTRKLISVAWPLQEALWPAESLIYHTNRCCAKKKKKTVHTPQTQQKTRFLSLFVLHFVHYYKINQKFWKTQKRAKTLD